MARCFQASLILFSAASLLVSQQVAGACLQRLVADKCISGLNWLQQMHLPASYDSATIFYVMSKALAVQHVLHCIFARVSFVLSCSALA
jgi:hypothetical protein